MPSVEQEPVEGYRAEYSDMKFALVFMAEYRKLIAASFIAATIFLGGYLGPFKGRCPWDFRLLGTR